MLKKANGNKAQASRNTGVRYTVLLDEMRRHGLIPPVKHKPPLAPGP